MNPLLLAAPWLAFPLIVPFLLRRSPRLRDSAPVTGNQPAVSIIVPARNEALNIGPCVATLLASDYDNREIIVVDDGSTDATGDVARALAEHSNNALRVITTSPLPDGWIGKSWACWTGYLEARGDLLLFTDADTRHDEELLARAVGALQQHDVQLLSLLPRQVMESFWERAVLPHIFLGIYLRYGGARCVNRARNPRNALANGQFMLVQRAHYENIDGHRAVRSDVVEDVALAQRTVATGGRLLLLHAHDLMATRMYRSLREIIEGWSKNLARGARLSFPPLLGSVIVWMAVLLGLVFWVLPPVLLLASTFLPPLAPFRDWAIFACAASLAGWLYVYISLRAGVTIALCYPLGALVASLLLARSAWRGARVEWRGRRYRADV